MKTGKNIYHTPRWQMPGEGPRVVALFRHLAVVALACVLLAGCASRHTEAPSLLAKNGDLRKTHYQGEFVAEDGVKIRFTVFQPALKPGAKAPLILQTNPFGFWRISGPNTPISHILTTGDVLRDAWDAGYWVVSFDQRGHGNSGDIMHIADPRKEARDVSQMIDWAVKNLAIAEENGDPLVGMMGESMGAGVQLVASVLDPRLDALVPIAPWYDLERTLAPNRVPKSGWLTLLVLAGNTLADYDNRLNGAYLKARGGEIEPWVLEYFDDHDVGWFCDRGQAPHADALILQGFRDVLFPVNEGLDIHACMKKAGRDVRLVGVEGGHLLPGAQISPGWVPGWHIEKNLGCDGKTQRTHDVIMAWFDGKLRGDHGKLAQVPRFCLTGDALVDAAGEMPPMQEFDLPPVHVGSGASGMVEWAARPLEHVGNWFVRNDAADWRQERNGWLRPARMPLLRADRAQWLVGVPRATFTIDNADRDAPVLFVQLAAWRPGSGSYRVLSEQVTPVRGTGRVTTDLAAVRGRIEVGEVAGLLVRGYQNQYRFSGSGWGTDASLSGTVRLPLTAAGEQPRTDKALAQEVVTSAPGVGTTTR